MYIIKRKRHAKSFVLSKNLSKTIFIISLSFDYVPFLEGFPDYRKSEGKPKKKKKVSKSAEGGK